MGSRHRRVVDGDIGQRRLSAEHDAAVTERDRFAGRRAANNKNAADALARSSCRLWVAQHQSIAFQEIGIGQQFA
jgi:hypothetical protein